ncbi:MAG: zinc-binding dehydrogenase [Anaerolineaceae bacterium]|nr:zinc-binding dehydrogenase [Anaerolineaceae bacterium]
MTESMKAVRIHQYGSPDVLIYEDAPRPSPAAGEVLVKVQAVGINPVDWKTRAGSGMSGRYGSAFPLIIGWDIAGVVEALGENADKFKVGDEVFGMVRFPGIGSAYAEYVAAPQTELALKPKNIDALEAAAYPLVTLTAWQALFEAGNLVSGERLLIQGAAGGVGHVAVQLATWKGAYVIGTGSTNNVDFLKELGVDQVVDYSTTRFEDVVEPVDMVLNCIGNPEMINRSLSVIKAGGRFVSIAGGADQTEAQKRQVKATSILVRPVESHLNEIANLIEQEKLKMVVTKVFDLKDMDKAHAFAESRELRRGKIVLRV